MIFVFSLRQNGNRNNYERRAPLDFLNKKKYNFCRIHIAFVILRYEASQTMHGRFFVPQNDRV